MTRSARILYQGHEWSLTELAALKGMHTETLRLRLKRMSVEEAVETPVKSHRTGRLCPTCGRPTKGRHGPARYDR